MKLKTAIAIALLGWCSIGWAGQDAAGPQVLEWSCGPRLPSGQGLAGTFAGPSGEALIVAGGTSFLATPPSGGGQRAWCDHVFVLTDPRGRWQTASKLPHPLACGVSVTFDDGVICLGGSDAKQHYADVFLIRWENGAITITDLTPMPGPNAFCCGALLGETIYVAGGRRQPDSPETLAVFWALDLSKPPPQRRWKQLQPWPGQARMAAVAAAQDGSFFIVGGVTLVADGPGDDKRVFLRDGYRYDPAESRWSQIADAPRPVAAAPSPAIRLGHAHFAIVGGDDGQDSPQIPKLKDNHPGFPAEILVYHTITDTWIRAGEFPKDPATGIRPPAYAPTTQWKQRVVVPGGQTRPGVCTANVYWAKPLTTAKSFGWADYGMLALYLAALVIMGFYFARRERSTEDFFLAGHRVPWWAAGLSIFGTQLSAITFMAIPALVYRTDWVYLIGNMIMVAMIPVVIYFYLPFYRQLEVTTAYEYLERRFNLSVRLLGSTAFLMVQVGRMGVVLYLPALALSVVTGTDVYMCIAVMGVLATLYTVLGGIEAVVWTDVLQVIVLMGGALLSLIIVTTSVEGGVVGVISLGAAAGKFNAANFTWDFTVTALWVVIVGRALEQLISFTADQTVVQRYLVTKDLKAAANALWGTAVLAVFASFIFFSLGTALWAFYKTHPTLLNITGRTDDVFPWFVVQQLPAGLAGLVIAGLLAAAMSSLDSSMNSMATSLTTDFYRRFNPAAGDHRCLVIARWLNVLLGTLGTGLAMYLAYLQSTSMWDQYIKIIGLFGGGLAGLFAVGIFTRRTHGTGVVIGFVASAGILYCVRTYTPVHFFLYAAIGVVSCFVLGYLASLVIPARPRDLKGLTIYTKP